MLKQVQEHAFSPFLNSHHNPNVNVAIDETADVYAENISNDHLVDLRWKLAVWKLLVSSLCENLTWKNETDGMRLINKMKLMEDQVHKKVEARKTIKVQRKRHVLITW